MRKKIISLCRSIVTIQEDLQNHYDSGLKIQGFQLFEAIQRNKCKGLVKLKRELRCLLALDNDVVKQAIRSL